MNKVKLLSIISIGLLAANLVLIWFLMLHRPPHQGHDGPKKVIIEKLDFNQSQIEAYTLLIEGHRANVQKYDARIKNLKNQLYAALAHDEQITSSDSLIALIGQTQVEIEQINYNHFQDIKQLCRPDQLKSFDELSAEIAELFSPKKMPPNNKH